MNGTSWQELAIAAAALLVMAVAASIEATAPLISRQRLRQLAESQGRQRTVQGLLDPRRSLVSSLLLIQVVAIAVAASLLTTVVLREVTTAEHLLAAVVVAAAYLLFGQALPRALASSRPERTAMLVVRLAGLLAFLARPLTALGDATARLLGRLLPARSGEAAPVGTEDELRSLMLGGDDDGVIEAAERAMIDNVLHLEATSVREIMVPRIDVVAVEESAPPREIVDTITGAGHSRIPVYRESIDQIVGVLYAKDLLPFVIGPTARLSLPDLVRPAYVVPESKRLDDLLTELRRHKVHIAIVADEYGGTAGLVTIEDILEEIVGEIQDEYDVEAPLVERVGDNELIADGRLPVEDVADALGMGFAEEDYDTIGGFVQHHLGRSPRQGDRFEAEGLRIEVLAVEGRRVRRMRLVKAPPPVAGDGTGNGIGTGGVADPAGNGGTADPATDRIGR